LLAGFRDRNKSHFFELLVTEELETITGRSTHTAPCEGTPPGACTSGVEIRKVLLVHRKPPGRADTTVLPLSVAEDSLLEGQPGRLKLGGLAATSARSWEATRVRQPAAWPEDLVVDRAS
jgi:hypothetical protein